MIPQKTLCYLLFVSVVILFVFVLIKLYISFQEITDEVKETTNGDYIIAGASSSDIYFLRLDSNGSVKAYCN